MSRLAPLLLFLIGVASCAPPPSLAYNPNPPAPPVRFEVIPKPPVSEAPLVWQPGHWDWTGQDYLWRDGRWVQRAGHGTTWQDGYWSNTSGRWRWIPAHWV